MMKSDHFYERDCVLYVSFPVNQATFRRNACFFRMIQHFSLVKVADAASGKTFVGIQGGCGRGSLLLFIVVGGENYR